MTSGERTVRYVPVKCQLSHYYCAIVHQFTRPIGAFLLLAGFLFLSATSAFGQMNTAEISGQVKDPSGATVPNASIVATEAGTGLKYTATSNASGEFLLAQLPVGQYNLTVNAQGLMPSTSPPLMTTSRLNDS